MRRDIGWMLVALLCFAAEASAADARLEEARALHAEADRLYRAGAYGEAAARGERAVALYEAVLGDRHPAVAACLSFVGLSHLRKGDPARAEALLRRSLAIAEATLGKDHPDVATALNYLGILYSEQGLNDRAEPLYQRALALRETVLGKDHPDVAMVLGNLAALYYAQGLYKRAEPLLQRSLAIREAALAETHPDFAASLNNLAALYKAQGLYERAEPLYRRSLAINEAALGKNHPAVALSLNNLAQLYRDQGLYERAKPLFQRALAIHEAALGKNHPDVATSLNNLAGLYRDQGLYERAKPLFQRSLALREAALGKNHPDVAAALNNLAGLYFLQGSYKRAEPLLQRSLAIDEAALGKNHPTVATSLNNLAELYHVQGSYGRAEPLFQRSLAIKEAALGKSHPDVAIALNNLAELYQHQGLYERAEPLLQRSLAINEAALGKNHPTVATSLNNLAQLYQAQGAYGRAELLLQRSLAIFETAFGKNHPLVATSLNNLARLYQEQGSYGRAEPLLQRALAIREAALGKNHPDVAGAVASLALLRVSQQRLTDALPLYERALTLYESRLRQEALDFSESRLAGLLRLLEARMGDLHVLLRKHPHDARVRRLALTATLLFKGRSLEETANISRAVYRSLADKDRESFQRLRGLRTELATLSLDGPGKLAASDYQRRLNELSVQGDAFEAELAKRSAPLRALTALPSPAGVVDRVAAAIPRDAALIELVVYVNRSLNPKPGTPPSERPRELRYMAMVLFRDGQTRAVDLGPAAPIDAAAARLRDALANRDASYQAAAQALHALAFKPLLPLLGDTRRLFLAPDGQLALIPFEALHDGQRFLVDSFDFVYVTSGKDLLPRPGATPASSSAVILADPDFGAAPSGAATTERASIDRVFSTLRADRADARWVPLPGTRKEAEALHALLPRAQLFLGAEASKDQLLHLERPGILHIATHGFFLEDSAAPTGTRGVVQFGASAPPPRAPDPLLRSGLVLAGARAPLSGPSGDTRPLNEGGLVTALEVAGLDLWGTELVVLSACDTGRGDVKLGQGVYGLRRAFVVAGAETLVMSLWNVNDDTTRSLMEAYYRNLLAGQGRAGALRQAMLTLRETHPHPHYWAPFVTIGQDAPLRGFGPSTP